MANDDATPLMPDWTDLTVEHNPPGILTMWGYYRGVRYEETLYLTNFEMAAIEEADHGRIERVIVRLMDKLRNKSDGIQNNNAGKSD